MVAWLTLGLWPDLIPAIGSGISTKGKNGTKYMLTLYITTLVSNFPQTIALNEWFDMSKRGYPLGHRIAEIVPEFDLFVPSPTRFIQRLETLHNMHLYLLKTK